MQLFECQACQQRLYFENIRCERCGHGLGYLPEAGLLSAVEPDGATWIALARPDARYRFCRNWEQSACNWLVDVADGQDYCAACQHNRTIPDLSLTENHEHWLKIETAKRRLVYSLIRLGLPRPTPASGAPEALIFDFLAEVPGGQRVMTGHDSGVITIALAEADDVTREAVRRAMGEPYRTLLGHFRHEVGHYYWDRLVRDSGQIDTFRSHFGDESVDYASALTRYYNEGPPPLWRDGFVSAYATMHPWEDWAETFAHYLHIVDTLEMAASFGIRLKPEVGDDAGTETAVAVDPYRAQRMETLLEAWLPLTFAVNSLNRAMGQPDLYPFLTPPAVVTKLEVIHGLIQTYRRQTAAGEPHAAPAPAPAPADAG